MVLAGNYNPANTIKQERSSCGKNKILVDFFAWEYNNNIF